MGGDQGGERDACSKLSFIFIDFFFFPQIGLGESSIKIG